MVVASKLKGPPVQDQMRNAAKTSDEIHPDPTDLLDHIRRLCTIDKPKA